METSERVRRVRLSIMIVAGVAALAAGLSALMWWKAQPAKATTDPGRILFASNRNATDSNPYDLYTMAPDGSDVKRITNRPGTEDWASLSPDGSKIAFVSGTLNNGTNLEYSEIFTVNSDGSGEVNITNTSSTDESEPSWSPDGQKIAYGSRDSTWEIYVSSADGSGKVNITNTSNTGESSPSWSHDGQKIAYSSANPYPSAAFDSNPTSDIYASNADGSGGRTNLTNTNDAEEGYPSWSHDGQKIAYSRYSYASPSSSYDIYKLDSDGTNQSLVVALSDDVYFADEFLPDWSPDGSQLAFYSIAGPGGLDREVFKVNSDGSGVVNLTDNTDIEDVFYSWGGSGSGDKVAPVLSLPSNMTVKAQGAYGAVVTFQASATDDVDGNVPVSCTPASGSTFPIGTTTVNCEATDAAGNKATGSFTASVVYNFGNGSGGFLAPIDNYPTLNSMKAGGTVPVKFSLGGDFGLDIFAAGYPVSRRISCDSQDPVDPVEELVTASNSGLKYDATTSQYSYNWKTEKSWSGTCRQLVIRLKDGSEQPVNFKFK